MSHPPDSPASTLVLHHYPGSPFAEKARLMLGYKGLRWSSVIIPSIMPKPDLVALTGGYRRTPVLQIGADVYCDTARIATLLEALQPEPTLFPARHPLAPMLAQWADSTLFWTVIPYTMRPEGLAHVFAGQPPEAVKAFGADRASFTAGMRRMTLADAAAQLPQHLAALQAQLADGRGYLFGDTPCIADFSVAHGLWFIHRVPPLAGVFDGYPALAAWLGRMLAIGHGHVDRIDSTEALRMAASAIGHAAVQVQPGLGFAEGQAITVAANDYGTDPVAGILIGLTVDEVVLQRHDERAGWVHVHFPRQGFQIKEQK